MTSGNSVTGDYTTSSTSADSATATGQLVNQTLTVTTTDQSETSTDTNTETGNTRFDTYTSTSTSEQSVTTTQSSTNQTLSTTGTATETTTTSVTRSGNRTSGQYTEDIERSVESTSTSNATNQTRSSESETSAAIEEVFRQIGNDITGLYTNTSTTTSTSSEDLSETNTDRNVEGISTSSDTTTTTGSGNSVTGAFTDNVESTSTANRTQSGTIGDRSFTLNETTSMTSSGTSGGNEITSQITTAGSSQDTYEYSKSTTYTDGSDTKSVTRSSSNNSSSTSNGITGVYDSSSTSTTTTDVTETGTRSESYQATSQVESSRSETASGNSVTGAFQMDVSSESSSSVARSLTDAAGNTLAVTETASVSSTDSENGNGITGVFAASSESAASQTTIHGVATPDGLHDHTATETVSSEMTSASDGNSVTGAMNATNESTVTTELSQIGTIAGLGIEYDSTTQDLSSGSTDGNAVTGIFNHEITSTETYAFTQTVERGPLNTSSTSGSGTKTSTRSITANTLTGDSSSSATGTDTFTLTESGSDVGGVFEVSLSGEDAFTETETTNGETGVFQRQTEVDGTVTGSRTVGFVNTAINEATDQVVTQEGNYIDGDIDITASGQSRYDSLLGFVEASSGTAGTPGNLDYSPTGVPLVLGDPPSLPTAGGMESISSSGVSQVGSPSASTPQSLTGAAFRGVESTAVPSPILGSDWSSSAVVDGFATLGGDAIEQYCFPAGTEILLADGTTKSIEQISVSDQVLSRSVGADETLGPAVSGRVKEVYHNAPQQLLEVHLGDRVLLTTAGHRFYVHKRLPTLNSQLSTSPPLSTLNSPLATLPASWCLAEELAPGDQLLTSDGSPVTITSVEPHEQPAVPVYNFHVAEHRNYHVRVPGSDDFVLVHNESFGRFTYGSALSEDFSRIYESSALVQISELTELMVEYVSGDGQASARYQMVSDAVFSFFEPAINFISDYANAVVAGVGVVADTLGYSDFGQSLITLGSEGINNNTFMGIEATELAAQMVESALAVSAGIAIGAATAAVVIVAGPVALVPVIGFYAGAIDAYIQGEVRADGGPAAWWEIGLGATFGAVNPWGAIAGLTVGGLNAALAYGTGENVGDGYRIGSLVGTILGTGGGAMFRSGGSVDYAMQAMAYDLGGAVGGLGVGLLGDRGRPQQKHRLRVLRTNRFRHSRRDEGQVLRRRDTGSRSLCADPE